MHFAFLKQVKKMYKIRQSITISKWVESLNPLALASKANLSVVCVCAYFHWVV